jgi:hypothetical protein
MGGMQLQYDSSVLLADFLARRGSALVELDLKRNQLDRKSMVLYRNPKPNLNPT